MLRKILVTGVMLSTVLSLSVFTTPTVNAAASAGDLIKMNGMSSVYYLGANGKRYVFPNEATYFSWYKDFSGVVTVPQSEIETYPLAANVVIRPGTKLVKSPSISTVYAVEPSGVLRSIVSEANAIALWGADWNKKVVDVIDAFFTNYTVGTPLTAGKYPAGQLIKTSGSPDVYVIGADGSAKKFASEAGFVSNNYSFDYVQTVASTFTMPASGSAVNGREDSLADVSQGGGAGSGVIAGTGITVALASNTPAAGSVPTNAPADFLKFNVTASNDGAATISSIKLTSGGLGAGADINDVTIYVDDARVGNSKNVDSNKEAIFNFSTGIVIPAGQTKVISVRASVAGTDQYSLGIARAADIVATGATISGSFPITGNLMSGISGSNIGTITATLGTAPANVKLGDKAAIIGSLNLSNNGLEDANIYSINLKKTAGSAADDDFENVGLYVSGTKVASSNGLKDKFVKFTFDTAYLLKKSTNKNFEVKADIVDGAAKDITLSLDSASDIVAIGKLYGTYSKISATTPVDVSVDVDINSGSIALAKDQPTATKVRKDTDDVVLGTIKITPTTGKAVELRTLAVTLATTTGVNDSDLENIEVMDKATGLSYELTRAASGKWANTSVDLNMNNGVTKELAIRVDIADTASNGGTIVASLAAASSDLLIYDEDNNAITDITPSSITFTAVTVEQPKLTVSTNPLSSALTVVSGTSNVDVFSFNLKANATDDLKVTQIQLRDEDGTAITSSVLSQVRLYKDGETTSLKALSGSNVDEVLTFDGLNINVPAGQEVKYRVTVDVTSGASGATKWGMYSLPTAEDVTKGETLATSTTGVAGYTYGMDSGRTVNISAAGSLLVEMDNTNSDTLRDRYEIAGNTTSLMAALKVRGANESINIEDLRIKVLDTSDASSTNANSIFSKLQIIDSDKTTVLKEVSNVSSETTVEDVNIVVPSTGSKTLYIKGVLNLIGKDQVGVDDQGVKFRVDSVIAKGVDSNQALIGARASSSASTCASTYVCYVTDGAATQLGTDSSLETGVLASKISSVDLVSAGGGCSLSSSLSAGWNTVAVIKVTTDNTSNTLTTGDDVKTILDTITVNHAMTGATTTAYTIERCGGTGGTVSETAASSSAAVFTVSGWSTDDEIAKSGTAYFAVKYYVDEISATAGAASVQVDLSRLDYASAKANFKWYDSTDASAKYPLRLSTNKITGTKINN